MAFMEWALKAASILTSIIYFLKIKFVKTLQFAKNYTNRTFNPHLVEIFFFKKYHFIKKPSIFVTVKKSNKLL